MIRTPQEKKEEGKEEKAEEQEGGGGRHTYAHMCTCMICVR